MKDILIFVILLNIILFLDNKALEEDIENE